ncbi:MAG: 2'-5' RNA ligase family protein [Bacteroidota bacterium]|nr:2'-5' RNA ligase family protein [Bacteroidota bacterium]MDP4229724.1 2'-5' RNA ligase family protein [Bacteroidota bacterium]MDP4235779.1 2'-5' RNA ligase family protein [Bacteroidota bacterium]
MTGTDKQGFYFIGIIPPEPVYSEIRDFQEQISNKWNSKEALRRPVHITLLHPFHLAGNREPELIKFLERFAADKKKLSLAIDGFGSFSIGVIYASIVPTTELKELEKDLSLSVQRKFQLQKEKGPSYGFNPHITIGYKDLSPQVFDSAWAEFKEKLYRRKWTADSISLLRHDGKEWKVVLEAKFESPSSDTLSMDL